MFGDWMNNIGLNKFCTPIFEKDTAKTYELIRLIENVEEINKYWNIKQVVKFKMIVLKFTLFFVIIGLIIDKIVEFINWILDCFGMGCDLANIDSLRNAYSGFMEFINMFVLSISYVLTIVIGIYIFTFINTLIHNKKKCIILNSSLIIVEKLLVYLFPIIIIASIINSSAKGLAPPSNDICDSLNTEDNTDYGIPDFIKKNIRFIFVPLVIFAILYFLFFNCYTHVFDKNKQNIYTLSTTYNLLIILQTVITSVIIFGFIYSKYSNVLISSYGLNFNYIVLLSMSSILYLIILKRPYGYEMIVSQIIKLLKGFFPKICSDDYKNQEKSLLSRFINLNKN